MISTAPTVPDLIVALLRGGETLASLAMRLGVTSIKIWRWQHGKARPHQRDRKKLLALYADWRV